MNEVLVFTNGSFYTDRDPETVTIQGEKFRALMDLCFAHADRFSLLRDNWPGSNDGPLEQALRPFCLGEYRSYRSIWVSRRKKIWEKCYLYPATEETKAILLRYIPHLFGREPSPAPEGHEAYLQKKYAAYYEACEAADNRIDDYLEAFKARTGHYPDDTDFDSFQEEARREARAIWRRIFDPRDYYSTMEDPCFFRGNEMFFETVTHEFLCFVHVLTDEFGAKLRELGEWRPEGSSRPFSLREAKGLVLYGEAKK